jgi:hypothetical protein
MLKQMAAQAIAAQITQKIFGSATGGGSSGWLGLAMGAIGSYFGGGSSLTPINVTAQRIPGYATGGYIPPGSWGMTGENGPEHIFGGRTGVTVMPNSGKAVSVTNNFMIQAPNGSVSRATQQQIAASAARGIAAANARNS